MINAMRGADLAYDGGGLIADGKLHRYTPAGDKPKSDNAWYVLYDGDIQAGRFGSWKTGQSEKWCSKSGTEFTPEEKAAYNAKMESARRQRNKASAIVAERCQKESADKWGKSSVAPDNHPYLILKQVSAFGLRVSGEALMVPVRAINGVLHGIQYIFPDGSKKFKTGTAKLGHFHMIGKPVDNTLIICEGYATGASIHMATGHGVLVAFDAGNLKAVAEAARNKQPEFILIIAADNDQWTEANPGLSKAVESAQAVKGILVQPRFVRLETRPTDFNDLHVLAGLDAVRVCVFPPPVAEYEPQYTDGDAPPPIDDYYPVDHTLHPLNNAPFRCLGFDHDDYYFLCYGTGQIKKMTGPNMTKGNMLTLAPLVWWEKGFQATGKQAGSFSEEQARNWLVQTCQSAKCGVYDSDNIRGLGAWEDAGRSVLHLGDKLIVDGQENDLNGFTTKYIYERSISISDEKTKPLSSSDANKMIQLCEMLSWEKPVNGRLLAGWCVAAIICGALRWRPHIWLTGPSGSGKSWIIHSIIKFIVGPHLKGMLSSTTEAGLRNVLSNNAFSVFFDEFEAEDKNAATRIQSILEFARPASSNEDSKIYKAKSGGGGVNSFLPRSCIGVASINVNMSQKADTSRVSVLSLVNGSSDHFKSVIVPFYKEFFDKPYARGLRARCIRLIPVINANAVIFEEAVTAIIGSRRAGDQYGSLLACAYSLFSDKIATPDVAADFVGRVDWDGHVIAEDQGDELQCLSAIMEGIVRYNGGERSIGELLHLADQNNANELARETLIRYGVKHVLGGFVVANKHSGIKKIMEKTPWADNWSRILARLPGAHKSKKAERFAATISKVVTLPITYVNGDN